VQDDNRNRTLDSGETYGVPPVHLLVADSLGTAPDLPWILAHHDTEAPVLERVRVLSPRDLELRFSESLDLDLNSVGTFTRLDRSLLSISDSMGSTLSGVQFHYTENRSRTLLARVDSLPLGSYILQGLAGVRDSSQNMSQEISSPFRVQPGLPPAEHPAFMMWTPDSSVVTTTTPRTIWPYESFGFRTTKPVDAVYASSLQDALAPSLEAVIRDTSGISYPARFSQVEPAFFVLEKTGAFSFNAPFYLDVNQKDFGGPDSVVTGLFEYATPRNVGSVSVVVMSGARSKTHFLQMEAFDRSQSAKIYAQATQQIEPEGSAILDDLPGGKAIQLRLSLIQNGMSSSWWPGSLAPWSPPDPISWIAFEEPVRARWETVLPDTVDFRNWPLRLAEPDSVRLP